MEIYANAYYTYEPGDFVILTTGAIVCVKSHDEARKDYVVTDATTQVRDDIPEYESKVTKGSAVYDHKFIDTGKNERHIDVSTIYMPVHQEYTVNHDNQT